MKLRVVFLAVILILTFAVAALAEATAETPKTAGAKQPVMGLGRKVVKELGLSESQVKQIRDIVQKYHQDVNAVFKSKAKRDEKSAQVKELRTKAAAAINAVLTPEQQTKAQQMKLIDHLLTPRTRPELGLVALVLKLDLTEDQKTKIKAITQPAEAQIKAIRQDSSIMPRQKAEKIAAIRKDAEEKIMALLTPEQKAKLEEMKKKQGSEAK